MNRFKNRDEITGNIDHSITIKSLIAAKNETDLDSDRAIEITGFVADVIAGTPRETCNCARSDIADIHIDVVAKKKDRLSRIWVAGVIPVFVGLALIFSGVFISKKALASSKRAPHLTSELTGDETPALRSANRAEFLPTNFSVTENTTRHLNQKEESR